MPGCLALMTPGTDRCPPRYGDTICVGDWWHRTTLGLSSHRFDPRRAIPALTPLLSFEVVLNEMLSDNDIPGTEGYPPRNERTFVWAIGGAGPPQASVPIALIRGLNACTLSFHVKRFFPFCSTIKASVMRSTCVRALDRLSIPGMFPIQNSEDVKYLPPITIDNIFWQWISWVLHRWRTQLSALNPANCKTLWIIEFLNANCTSGSSRWIPDWVILNLTCQHCAAICLVLLQIIGFGIYTSIALTIFEWTLVLYAFWKCKHGWPVLIVPSMLSW